MWSGSHPMGIRSHCFLRLGVSFSNLILELGLEFCEGNNSFVLEDVGLPALVFNSRATGRRTLKGGR